MIPAGANDHYVPARQACEEAGDPLPNPLVLGIGLLQPVCVIPVMR